MSENKGNVCAICGESMQGYEHWVIDSDGEKVHTHCHLEEEDSIGFDNDFGCSG